MMHIRPAQPADLPHVGELFDLYRQFYERVADPKHAAQYIAERQAKGESQILVAETPDAGLIGFCQLYPLFCSLEAAPIYSLSDLFVLPTQRKRGAGRALLLGAEALARAHGKVRLELTTARNNLTAQRLYESLGWVRDEVFLAYARQVTA